MMGRGVGVVGLAMAGDWFAILVVLGDGWTVFGSVGRDKGVDEGVVVVSVGLGGCSAVWDPASG